MSVNNVGFCFICKEWVVKSGLGGRIWRWYVSRHANAMIGREVRATNPGLLSEKTAFDDRVEAIFRNSLFQHASDPEQLKMRIRRCLRESLETHDIFNKAYQGATHLARADSPAPPSPFTPRSGDLLLEPVYRTSSAPPSRGNQPEETFVIRFPLDEQTSIRFRMHEDRFQARELDQFVGECRKLKGDELKEKVGQFVANHPGVSAVIRHKKG